MPIYYADAAYVCNYYWLTLSQMQNGFPIHEANIIGQLFTTDPMNYIMDVRIYPFVMLTSAAEAQAVKVGKQTMPGLYGLRRFPVYTKSSSIAVPAGASFLDFEPYSTAQIYLPYLGFYPINLREIRGDTVNIRYELDVSMGECTCFLTRNSNSTLINTVTGSIGESIPIIGSDARERLQRRLSTAVTVGAGLATGGGAGAIVSGFAGGVTQELGANGPKIKGTFSGGQSEFNSPRTPFIVINTQKSASVTSDYRRTKGLPAGYTATLSSLSGYTEVESVHVEGFACTSAEAEEIEQLLKSGVIF